VEDAARAIDDGLKKNNKNYRPIGNKIPGGRRLPLAVKNSELFVFLEKFRVGASFTWNLIIFWIILGTGCRQLIKNGPFRKISTQLVVFFSHFFFFLLD
jgi:hypothetical protein